VFDSGLGGLSVAREILAMVPQARLLYYGDTACFPYGTRDEAELIERVLERMALLEARFEPALIVVACNTASTSVLPDLRAQTATPVVGVVPAVKPAAALTDSGVLGLLATPGTVLRAYTQQLIEDFAGHCEVVSVGSSELVQLAEAKLLGTPVSSAQLQPILARFTHHPRHAEIDTIVLACTHFPLLRGELARAYDRPVQWLDSGRAIALRVRHLLRERLDLAALPTARHHLAYFSAPPRDLSALGPFLGVLGIEPQAEAL
jgi:glutamate racemase